ncbi:TBC domain-containing protein [Cyclospora cayetanensis]|uniref:TBC domain-containing protein n=1 Tax=Cyclospora cayetanensis TaxID=88456 RepID=A0A1D3D7L4_9EIME|nr:TBC domain-containing protein [Cyclospora cayetanensis]
MEIDAPAGVPLVVQLLHILMSAAFMQYYSRGDVSAEEVKLLKQLRVDLPRTHAGRKFFAHPRIQLGMERVLFLWAVKHPASGYVQGINDLLTPFVAVFLHAALGKDPEELSIDEIDEEVLVQVEADSFWCLAKLLAHIQDHYTSGQPGIRRLVVRLRDIVKRVDGV